MKRIALCLTGIVAASIIAFAQAPAGRGVPPPPPPPLEAGASQAEVDTALLAAPANLKDQATVIKWKPDQTYTTLRKGTNRLVCYDRSGFPLQQAFSIECTMLGNLDRVAQNMKIEALGDRAKAQAAFDELEKNGTRVKPEFGSVFYHIQGPEQEMRARPHDDRHARRDDGDAGAAGQRARRRRLDHERGHDDRPPHGSGRITTT